MEIVIKLNGTEALEQAKTLELTFGHKEKRKYSDDMYKALSLALNCLVHGKGGPMPSEVVDIARSYDSKNQIHWTPIKKIMEGM